jgi:hypothetical protein
MMQIVITGVPGDAKVQATGEFDERSAIAMLMQAANTIKQSLEKRASSIEVFPEAMIPPHPSARRIA